MSMVCMSCIFKSHHFIAYNLSLAVITHQGDMKQVIVLKLTAAHVSPPATSDLKLKPCQLQEPTVT